MRWDPEKHLDSDGECRRNELFYLLDTGRRLLGGSQVGFGVSCTWDGRNLPPLPHLILLDLILPTAWQPIRAGSATLRCQALLQHSWHRNPKAGISEFVCRKTGLPEPKWMQMALMTFYCLGGFCCWIQRSLGGRERQQSQSQPKHQIRAAVTLWEGWPGWLSLPVTVLGQRDS